MIRNLFSISGIVLFLIFTLMIITNLIDNGYFNYNSLLFLSMAILSFSQYYVFPHLKDNDERSKKIKVKSIFYSSLIFLILLGIFILIISTNLISIEIINLLKIFITFFIIIYSIILIFISKKI